jgi:hypothetical protein
MLTPRHTRGLEALRATAALAPGTVAAPIPAVAMTPVARNLNHAVRIRFLRGGVSGFRIGGLQLAQEVPAQQLAGRRVGQPGPEDHVVRALPLPVFMPPVFKPH